MTAKSMAIKLKNPAVKRKEPWGRGWKTREILRVEVALKKVDPEMEYRVVFVVVSA